MDEFCGSKFWDWELTWYTNEPKLTECFEKTVLAWIPAIFIALFGSLDVVLYSNGSSKTKRVTAAGTGALSSARFAICVILGLIQIVQLCDTLNHNHGDVVNPPPADILGPMVKFFSFMAAFALAVLARFRGVPSSGIQLGFWFLVAMCELFPFLHNLNGNVIHDGKYGVVLMLLQHSYYPLTVIQFLLFCWSDSALFKTEKCDKPSCPEKKSSALSRLLFCWFDSLAWTGFRKPLEESDLWKLDEENTAEVIAQKFESNWEAESIKKKTSISNGQDDVGLVTVLFKTFGSYFLIGSLVTAVPDLLDITAPRILSSLLGFIGSDEENWKGYFYALLLLLVTVVTVLARAQYTHIVYMTGFRVKTALMSAVYRKALKISHSAKKDVGEIANLMSVDVQKVLEVIPYINMAWSSPLQISVALYLLWNTIGPSILAGVAVMVLLIPINGVLGNLGRIFQVSQMKNKDERVKLTTEVIGGMKVIKFYGWEESFEDKILNIRNEEVKSLRRFACLNAGNEYLWFGSQFFVVLATFTTYILSSADHALDAHKIFVTLALINVMTVPLTALPRTIILAVQAAVSLGRLNKFLNAHEVGTSDVEHDEKTGYAINLSNYNFGWSRRPSTETLKRVDLQIPEGAVVAVVGPVGSGKSSLVSAILGELEKYGGRVNTKGSISYVAQEAWVQQGTIRNNIIFGKPYERLKYKIVVEACCLLKDFDIFADRDKTVIGERGMNLSGGQRQRISLARALYNDADIFLLDDPLSAVDPEVGQKIFDNVIGPNGLLKRKTRVLVTHDARFLPLVDKIVVMSNGEVSQVGTYLELLNEQGAFSKYLLEYAGDDVKQASVECNTRMQAPEGKPFNFFRGRSFRSRLAVEAAFEECSCSTKQRMSSFLSSKPHKKPEGTDEIFETTSVPWSLYLDYFRAGGFRLMLPSIVMFIVYQGFAIGANVSLTAWSSEPIVNGTQGHQGFYLGVYAALGALQSFAFLAAALLVSLGALRASNLLHSSLLNRVLRAPMWFFDITPAGRLICRFGKDVDVLDSAMGNVVRLWLSVLVSVLATLGIILYTVPMFVVVCVPAAIVYIVVQKLYIPTSRQLRRLESVTQAPVYSYFGETVAGVTTIRAYGQQHRFLREALQRIDRHQSCYFPTLIANRWLSVRLETIAGLIKFSAALFAVVGRDSLSPGLTGLCITYAINVTFYLGQLVRSFCDVETNIVSVERIQEYCKAPQENPWKLSHSPSSSWPSSGCISFSNYKANYREGLDLVLKGVDCTIQPGEKVGVVGRTGAGKSSLVLALFRIIEPVGGEILIDDQDISEVGLHDLRSRLTIIPQDPVLFSGTLRFNLDPFGNFSDNAIWRAIELSHLRDLVNDLPGQLGYEISEGGADFSVGQKQLVCLARALLHKSKILVLDEATASVDLETDSLIQETIRKEFSDCTVVTIAHRLKTVMDCDRIIVMDAGTIREFDSPANLLRVHNSRFYLMAKDAGLTKNAVSR